ncbi:PstS family phosphate ABC transporter substrate-binding protein [Aquibacillus albus]|uniref:Phosphate-binding protein n=1 Tax=Aquibacillus albus TaxID=1168171 RepID=A0ABS2MUY8_9BACI|nr:PstS family phosphate ABC transporter substrate-binding protein [Aquibacillus albus]MBM7569656.1 phosphate transport system substrate-binding protein [Aquibacillus albus]
MKNIKLVRIFALLMLTFGLLAACGVETEDNNTGEGGEQGLSGEVLIDGSSTVFPIMEGLTYQYNKENPNVELSLNSSGSGGGFKKSTVGEIDLSNASRPIQEEEIAIAEENGIELHEIELAYDGLSVVVSQENDFIENITVEQLRQIFLADSDATKWSDINPEWPEETITIYSPGHDSGTFDYFNEVILEDNPMKEGENVTLNEDDNLLVQGIQNDPYAIGYFGYAYYLENQDSLKVLGVSTGDGEPVKPNGETIQDGSYTPLSRPVFTYVNVASLEKPQVYDFVKFTLENAGEASEQVGYVALPEENYQEQLDEINNLAGK